jgi:hypothetical protein
MDINKLTAVVTILLTLSIATERLVEIARGLYARWLVYRKRTTSPLAEALEPKSVEEQAWDKARVSLLAVVCGLFTAFLTSPILAGIFKNLFPDNTTCKNDFFKMGEATACGFDWSGSGIFLIIALGLLASGGSSLWNSVLEYLVKLKDLKKAEATRSQAEAAGAVRIARLEAAGSETTITEEK